jgi:hypothetical protein
MSRGFQGVSSMKTLLLAVVAASPAFSAAFTFNSDNQGWNGANLLEFPSLGAETGAGVGTFSAGFQPSGGDAGGHITLVDPDDGVFYFNAPASVLGNQVTTYGTTLSYEIRLDGNDYHGQPDVVLIGNGMTLVASTGVDGMPAGIWNAASISLTPAAGWHIASFGGAEPTPEQFQGVLADLTALRIRGEYVAGGAGVETARLDNVSFAAVPEPSSYAIVGAGLAALFALARRGRNRF